MISEGLDLGPHRQLPCSPTEMTKVRLGGQLRDAEGVGCIEVCEAALAGRSVETGQALHSFSTETDDAWRARRLFEDEGWR